MIKKMLKFLNKKEPKVFIIRHGKTDFNGDEKSEDRIRGWIDVKLNDQGRKDAEDAANKLKDENPSIIFASDLVRATETAEIINKEFETTIITTSALRPWNLGNLQGQPTKEVLNQMNFLIINDTYPAPGGGETFKQFRTRYLALMEKIINAAIQGNETIFVVSHFRNLITFDAWVEAGYPKDYSIDVNTVMTDRFKTGEILQVDIQDYIYNR